MGATESKIDVVHSKAVSGSSEKKESLQHGMLCHFKPGRMLRYWNVNVQLNSHN